MNSSNALTQRQHEILNFVRRFVAKYGYSPTVREITDGCHHASTSVTVYNLNRMAEMGLLKRTPVLARSIVLTEQAATV